MLMTKSGPTDTMKIGVISDIEGNHKRLEQVLRSLANCDSVINLGDSIGNKGDSNRVITLLNQRNIKSILGNHDLEVILQKSVPASKVNAELFYGSKQLYHPETNLSDDCKIFVKSLRMNHTLNTRNITFGFYHSFCGRYGGEIYFDYIDKTNALFFIDLIKVDVVFVGHKHISELIVIDSDNAIKSVGINKSASFKLDKTKRCVINVGSIGASRAKEVEFSYSILDLEKKLVRFIIEQTKR